MNDASAPPWRRVRSRDAANADELNDVATDLILAYGGVILRDAQRYSSCAADAEDAYQRAIEALLTKAPQLDREQLLPWIRRVARNEAIDISRQRKHVVPTEFENEPDRWKSCEPTPEESAESAFELNLAIEALERLTHDQATCLRIQADGHSYSEIERLTGFSTRKVTRCITEGRRAFARRTAAIEAGSECDRVEPFLHRIVDGDTEARRAVALHLTNCGACQATLRSYAAVSSRMTLLFPPAVLAVHEPSGLFAVVESAWQTVVTKAGSQAYSVQQWAEFGSAKKIGAVVAVSAAVASSGTLVTSRHDGEAHRTEAAKVEGEEAARRVKPPDSGTTSLPPRIRTPLPRRGRTRHRNREAKTAAELIAPEAVPAPPASADSSPAKAEPVASGVGDLAP